MIDPSVPHNVNLLLRFDRKGSPDDIVSTTWSHPTLEPGASIYQRKDPIFGGARWVEGELNHAKVESLVHPAAAAVRELLLNSSGSHRSNWGMREDPQFDRERLYDFTTNTPEGEYDLVLEVDGPAAIAVHGAIVDAPAELRQLMDALIQARS